MCSYAKSQCRRRYLIEYFGQTAPWEQCGTCDQCKKSSNPPISSKQKLEVRKILACIARMEKFSEGKWFQSKHFSPHWIAEVLKGDEKRIKKFGFQKLSTFALMERSPKQKILDILNDLFLHGYLDVQHTTQVIKSRQVTYKLFGLNQKGWEVMMDEEKDIYLTVYAEQERKSEAKRSKKAAEKERERQKIASKKSSSLFLALKRKRAELARKEGVSQVYRVATDAMLYELETQRPSHMDALVDISGFGPWRIKKYGEYFLEVIRSESS